MKTITPTQLKGDERKWYIIDAKEQTLGRLATKIAVILKGKNKDGKIIDEAQLELASQWNKSPDTWGK